MKWLLLVSTICVSGVVGASQPQLPADFSDVRGAIVFKTYCALCHGYKADGSGRAARNYNPRPANLLRSAASDDYKRRIIRRGGAALGRSEFMPPWGNELTDEQIDDVVYFLRVIQGTGN